MSDEIKQEPVDKQPAKELSTDELGKVTGGCFGSLVVSAILKPQVEEPPQPPKDPAERQFQQIVQSLIGPQ
jgi:hypothetical protein